MTEPTKTKYALMGPNPPRLPALEWLEEPEERDGGLPQPQLVFLKRSLRMLIQNGDKRKSSRKAPLVRGCYFS
jgi:hypothetical protein